MLLVPPGYAWEHEGPVEIAIQPDKRSFFLLKLFRHDDTIPGEGPEGSSGGSGSGGAPGTPPP